MHYLVDTYNLVHAGASLGGPLSHLSVRKLCQFIAATPASTKVTLVLDGRPKPDEPSQNEFPDITLLYSGTGVKADTVIAQKVELSKSRKQLTVVTNDRAVTLHARRHYAHAISCESFIKQLTGETPTKSPKDALPQRKTHGTPTAGESDHWLKEFGLGVTPLDAKSPPPPPANNPEIYDLNIEDLLGPPSPP